MRRRSVAIQEPPRRRPKGQGCLRGSLDRRGFGERMSGVGTDRYGSAPALAHLGAGTTPRTNRTPLVFLGARKMLSGGGALGDRRRTRQPLGTYAEVIMKAAKLGIGHSIGPLRSRAGRLSCFDARRRLETRAGPTRCVRGDRSRSAG